MGKLTDRIALLEEQIRLRATDVLDEETRRRFECWPKILLQRYCEGRLDALAQELEPLRKLLDVLARHGYAVQQGNSWHPLYRVEDDRLTEALIKRLNASDVESPICA